MSAFLSVVSSQFHSAAIACIFVVGVPPESVAQHE
jgi:hypothetical protein